MFEKRKKMLILVFHDEYKIISLAFFYDSLATYRKRAKIWGQILHIPMFLLNFKHQWPNTRWCPSILADLSCISITLVRCKKFIGLSVDKSRTSKWSFNRKYYNQFPSSKSRFELFNFKKYFFQILFNFFEFFAIFVSYSDRSREKGKTLKYWQIGKVHKESKKQLLMHFQIIFVAYMH